MRLPLLALLVLSVFVPPVQADWWLWESPTDDAAYLGPEQATFTQYHVPQNGNGVGQSFIPTANYIHRIDFMLTNRFDRRPLYIKLWKWDDTGGTTPGCTEDSEYADTVAQQPVWSETFLIPGPSDRLLWTVFPQIPVTMGEPYYLEFSNDQGDGEFAVYSAWDTTDRYTGGMLRVNNHFRFDDSCIPGAPPPDQHGDMYFRVYSGSGSVPESLTCADGSPAPCFSAAGDWTDPEPAGPAITQDDYKYFIEEKAESRASILSPSNDGHNASRYTVLDAFLYAADDTSVNADYAVALFRKAYEWREANLDEHVGFTWAERPGWAYYWLRDYPGLQADDEALVKSLLLHSGLRFWENREMGAFNRALGGALTYKLIGALIPGEEFDDISTCSVTLPSGYSCLFQTGEELDANDRTAWLEYADEVWTEFTDHWDFTEDSGSYHYLSLRYVVEIDQLAVEFEGQPSIWYEDGFRALVERFYHLHTPLGPYPRHGDGNGWNQTWASPALLFETAATRYQDTRYRWLAYRLVDYHRSYALTEDDDPSYPELWEIVYNEWVACAFAYFNMDENLAPLQPGPQAEVQAASQDLVATFPWKVGSFGTGQTFEVTASPLVRLDFKLRNLGNTSPGTVRLWKWHPSGYAATIAQTPLYEDSVDLSGADVIQDRSFYPFLDVVPGDTYFVQFSRSSYFAAQGARSKTTDYYPDGGLYFGGLGVSHDLWFRTYTLSGDGSLVLTRLEAEQLRVSQRGEVPPREYEVFGTEQVPDKLILRSGYDPGDLHAVINLIVDSYGHGQAETGSFLSLINDGALLLSSTSYYDKQDKDQSRGIFRRYWDGTFDVPSDVPVLDLDDYRMTSVASIRWEEERGWGTDIERRVFLIKNRFLLVRDGFSFGSGVFASAGNIWHGYDVRPEHEASWYDLYNRVPEGLNGFVYKNPEQYLLTSFVDRGYQYDEWEVDYSAGNPPSAQFIASQRWTGSGSAGTTQWLDTVLLPHDASVSPWQAAYDTTVRYDDGQNLAVSVDIGNETWTVVDNPEGITINAGDLVTDATYLVTRTLSGAPYVLAHEATTVYVNDGSGAIIDMTWPVSTTVEIMGGTATCPAVYPCSGGGNCLPGFQLGNTDTGLNSCTTPQGGLILCGPDKTVHHRTFECHQAPCCTENPACLCLNDCGTGGELICQ